VTAPVPADGGAATGGLGEEARAALLSELASAVQAAVNADPVALYRLTEDEAGDLVCRIAENVLPLLTWARAEGAAEARRDAITRLTGFGVDPAVVEHFRSLLP
jgi:hypothetical protein